MSEAVVGPREPSSSPTIYIRIPVAPELELTDEETRELGVAAELALRKILGRR
ncbi:hypothetical protein [Streptomyces hydrogenans]|uniref:Uncharacterized protein n=1 Tax=Streptomyces hydrogenans TaxID=1873719 RepID=A0ABQ3PJD9_9ACTN|nr:hypothetical protein [Streptomyces hydrogenans]GHF94483.1 hypothetical protein GCM10018784_02690 [Streptomyces hydrogenans]GHI25143.1 hypothetical protein Shyd_65140 [Streptomyces hydrogenans]